MAQTAEDIKWLYGKLKAKGYNIGTEEEFTGSLANAEDRQWYYDKAKGMGLNVGSMEDFDSLYAPAAAPAAQPQRWQPTEQEKIQMAYQRDGMLNNANQWWDDRSKQTDRMLEPYTAEGREKLKGKQFEAQMAGADTRLMGLTPTPQTKRQETVDGDQSEGSKPYTPPKVQSPVPYGVKYLDGKAVTEWLLPDGRLTTSMLEADQAEYTARQGRQRREFEARMARNSLDPAKPEDAQKQAVVDAIHSGFGMDKGKRAEWVRWLNDNGLDGDNQQHILWAVEGNTEKLLEHRLGAAEERLRTLMSGRQAEKDKAADSKPWYMRLGASINEGTQRIQPTPSGSQSGAAESELDAAIRSAQAEVAQIDKALRDYRNGNAAAGRNWFGQTWQGLLDGITDPNTWTAGIYDLSINDAARRADITTDEGRRLVDAYVQGQTLAAETAPTSGWYSGGHFAGEMLADPITYIAFGVGSVAKRAAVKGVGKAATKAIEKEIAEKAAVRFAERQVGNRIVGAMAGSGANLFTFEGLRDMRQQVIDGGWNDSNGDFQEGFSWGHALKQGGHGFILGTAMGLFGGGIGNVGNHLVSKTGSTWGKVGVRVGQHSLAYGSEASIFAMPEIIEFHTMDDDEFDKMYAEKFGYADETDEAERNKARDKARNSLAWDAWGQSAAMVASMKIAGKATHGMNTFKSAEQVIEGLRGKGAREHTTFGERVSRMMDASPFEVGLIKDEREELKRGGYESLTDFFVKGKAEAREGEVDGEATVVEEILPKDKDANLDGYEAMQRLMKDGRISQSTRAKLYYMVTGHMLPMGTVTGYETIETEDGKVIVNSVTASGEVVTTRTFGSKAAAQREMDAITRQAELNSVDVGEAYAEARADEMVLDKAIVTVLTEADVPRANLEAYKSVYRAVKMSSEEVTEEQMRLVERIDKAIESSKEAGDAFRPEKMRQEIKDEAGVDVDEALRKPKDKRSEAETAAIEAYSNRLFPERVDTTAGQEQAKALLPDDGPVGAGPQTEDVDAKPIGHAVMKFEDRPVEVMSGRVAMTEDGTMVDMERSDKTIVIRDSATGKVEMVSPDAILSYEDYVAEEVAPTTEQPQSEKKYGRGEITVKDESGAANYGWLTGYVDEQGRHEYYLAGDALDEHGPKLRYATDEELDAMVTDFKPVEEAPKEDAQPQAATIDDAGLTGERSQPIAPEDKPAETLVETPAPVVEPTALERLPRDEKGEPDFDKAENPEHGWDALVEYSEGDKGTAKIIADAMVEEKHRAYEKAQKSKPKGKTPAEILASKRDADAALAQAEAEYNLWRDIAEVEQRRENARLSAEEAENRRLAAERAAQEKAEREAAEEAARIEREALEGIPEWHNDTPQNARARGSRRYAGQLYVRQEPIEAANGKDVEVKFSQADLPKGRVAVIEASQLQPSHLQGEANPMHFIDEAQPKNRAEDVSKVAARQIAEGIRPEEITSSATAYTGAPTVNARGEVIQGNNRSDALRYLWDNSLPEQQAAYRQYLVDNAERLGLDPEEVKAMRQPVLVNMLDVDDAEAIRLGQMTAQDTESGGVERIKPKNVAQTLGEDMRTLANTLLRSGDEEATFGQLVDRNGADALRWLNERGAISNTQYQSAFDSKGSLTGEAKNDLQKVLYQAVFKGGSQQLEEMFDSLPAKAQRALLATAFRDMDSPLAGKMLPELQASIAAYSELMHDPNFAGAKNLEQALRAVEAYKMATTMDDRGEIVVPAEKFSNFALQLAAMYKASDMSQATLASYFNQMYDLAQGKKAASLFEEADPTQYPLAEVIKKTLGIDYKPAKNGKDNDRNGSSDVAVGDKAGQGGQRGSSEPPASREQPAGGTEPSDRGARTTDDGAATAVEVEPEAQSPATVQSAVEAASAEVNTEPTPAQAEAGNYKKGHVTIGEFNITIENPAGSERKGVDAAGKEWSTTMANTYGYIRGTEGVDGDHIDVFLHEDMDSWNGRKVFVVDQTNNDGSFDEHKVMLGFNDKDEAMSAYLANYDKTWADTHPGLRISETNIEDFNKWVQSSHRKTKPFADYSTVNKVVDDAPVKTEPQKQPSAAVEGDGYKIASKPYTNRQGKTLDTHLVTFDREPSKEELSAMRAKAKDVKGWYDREAKGWMLRSQEDAKAFAEEFSGKSEDEIADDAPLSMSDLSPEDKLAVKKVDIGGVADALKAKGETKLSDHSQAVETQKPKKRKWVSDEDAAEFDRLRDGLRDHLGVSDGIANEPAAGYGQPQAKPMDAEVLRLGTRMTYLMMKGGLRKFADYAEAMVDEIGDGIRPHLKSLYAAAQNMEEVMALGWDEEMDDRKAVKAFDVYNFDKPGPKDIIATAQQVVDETESQKQTQSIIDTLKGKRNEERRKEADKTSADSRAVVRKAEIAADEVESQLEDARTEDDAQQLADRIDQTLETVNKQLALLGYYEADEVEKDFNEAYGYQRNAERKATQDAHRLATQLAKDLGVEIDAKDKVKKDGRYGFGSRLAHSNVAPAGGEVHVKLPLPGGRELCMTLYLEPSREWRDGWRAERDGHDDLLLTGIMMRVENPQGKGAWERYGMEANPPRDVTYDDLLAYARRLTRHYLPDDDVRPAAPLTPKPGEDYVKLAERVAKDSQSQKEPEIAPEQSLADLFSNVEDNNTNQKDKPNEKTDVQPGAEETGRGRQQPRSDEQMGAGARNEDERADRGGVAQRGGEHTVPDAKRGEAVSGQHKGERGVKNARNNHAEPGVDYAPKGEKARIDANIAAIETAKRLLEAGAEATAEDMAVLRKYSGWGGLGSAFNEGRYTPNPINVRLRELLTPEEYEAAVMSRNSAYYTPAEVIGTMWDVAKALGFKGGRILEGSAGIGNILGLMPTEISERSDIHAVEIEKTTGGILSLLYPDAKVDVQGFEVTRIPNGSVDLAITNVPFVTGLHVKDESGDIDLSKKFRDIHDFCIAKNTRKLREGGIGVFITSSGTMDRSHKLRGWLVDPNGGNADVVGAFRMHNQTFGGTTATSDIIVVRKRVGGRPSANAIDVSSVMPLRTAAYEEGKKTKELPLLMNRYFIEHPEHTGGEMYFGFEQGDTYRPQSIGLFPVRGVDQAERMAEWGRSLADKDWGNAATATPATAEVVHVNDKLGKDVKEGSMVLDSEGNLYVARMGEAVPLSVNKNKIKGRTKQECFQDYTTIREALDAVLKYHTEHDDDAGLKPLLDKLNKVYDTFVERYGNLNRNTSLAWLRNNDIDFPSIAALEAVSERGGKDGKKQVTYGKTDIFSGRVVEKEAEPAPTNIKDGIIASLYKFGRIDTEYLSKQLGKSQDELRREIVDSGLGFVEPTTGQMIVSYEYLSGNVREKLRQAREAEESAPGSYSANIKALESVVPMNIPAHLIEFSLGSSWIDQKLYEDYMRDKTDLDVKLTNVGGTWYMDEPYFTDKPKNEAMGIRSEELGILIPGHKLIEAAITNKTITVSKSFKNVDGTSTTKTDQAATSACAAKVDEIRQDFKDWARERMQADPDMSMRMEEIYNEQFNNSVPMSIPDEFVPEHFGGAATMVNGRPFKLRPHQAKAAIRATTQPVMLAHEVGTGKTYTLITAAMEMRRLGTARKPMIVVQNATVGQFVASAKALYPNAKVLTLEDADRTAEGRKTFYAKIKFNDWDMIVVPQSVFERIPDSIERQTMFIQDKIEEKMTVLEQMKVADPSGKSMIVRQAQKEIERLSDEIVQLSQGEALTKKRDAKKEAVKRQNAEVRAKEMLDRDTDDVDDFDSMGIDAILVDEAHEYKHLGFATAMQRGVKGIDPSFSKKSQGVFLKTQSVLERTGGKNVVFATGTPISNTAAEIWTFMRYLMPADAMKDYGIYYFDDFVRNFGNLQQMLEFATSGKYKENNRFAGYVNLPELVRIWSTVADTVLTREAGGVSDKIPAMDGGKAKDLYLPQTKALRGIMKYVKSQLDAYEKMSGKEKKENSHIPLVMYGIAKAAAVDARLVQADATDDPHSKTNEAVRQTMRTLEETKDYKGTVAIFADNYQNKASGFNLYEDIRKKLIAQGVPEEQIVVMKSGMSIKQKLEIFSKVNSGEVRVIMGSTFTLGTGVNIQERLHTLIHVDAPNRPMDYTQRNGRILRQGNLHKDWNRPVRILRFGVEDSLDVTAYQRLKTKGAIADSIMNGKSMMENSMENRSLEEEQDIFGDITAQLSGSEYAMLKNQVEKEVRKLVAKQKAWAADQTYIHNRKRQLIGQNREAEQRIAESQKALETLSQAKGGDIVVGKRTYHTIEEMEDFFKAHNKRKLELQEQVRKGGYNSTARDAVTVTIGGLDFKVETEIHQETKQGQGTLFATAPATMTYSSPVLGIEKAPVSGNMLKNAVVEIKDTILTGHSHKEKIYYAEQALKRGKEELESIEAREGMPFQQAEELAKAEQRLSELEELMKKELSEKEAKYAEMDKDVEAAVGVEYSEAEEEEAQASEPVDEYNITNEVAQAWMGEGRPLEDYEQRTLEIAHELDFERERLTEYDVVHRLYELQTMWEALTREYGEEPDDGEVAQVVTAIERELKRWRETDITVLPGNIKTPTSADKSGKSANFAHRYETKDGKQIDYESESPEAYGGLFQFDFSAENARSKTADSGARADGVRRESNPLDSDLAGRLNSKAGEFCHVERVFTEKGGFDFTAGERIESADDVAFIFSALEDAAKEHSFVVLVKDGKPTVVELGMGTFSATLVDTPTAMLAYSRIKPDEVYFVHNHPSGQLICSPQDRSTLSILSSAMPEVPVHGVIINLKSGKYGTFNDSGDSGTGNKHVPETSAPLTVYTLDKQIFSPGYDPMAQPKVISPKEVAAFLNSHRMGDRAKVSFLIINHGGRIIGNIHTPFKEISTDIDAKARYISERIIQFGGSSAILYGDFKHTLKSGEAYRMLKKSMLVFGQTNLLDVVRVKGNNTESAQDAGILYEPQSDYTPSEGGLRFREVEDKGVLDEFASGRTVKAYRTMQLIDGKLYSPMATKVGGKTTPEIRLGVAEQAEEHPEIIKGTKPGKDGREQGYVVIDKGLGKGTLQVAYNPYIHASRTVLNDQFTSAHIRPNLVVVEVEIPESELNSGYRADKAKDAVGEIPWHSGTVSGQLAAQGNPRRVILSRYDRPVRILTAAEQARMIAEQLEGTGVEMPYNLVTPQVRAELERLGVPINSEASGSVGKEAEYGRAEYVTDEDIKRINAKHQELSQTSNEAKLSHAEGMSRKFNTPIRVVTDTAELTSKDKNLQERMRKSKGYYDTKTGEVVVVLPNYATVEDVAETVFHEVVAHKGLREMIGEENYDAFCYEIYDHLKDELKQEVDEETTRRFINDPEKGYEHHRRESVDEMFGRMAEKGFEDFTRAERGIWQKIKEKVLDAINKFLGALKLPKWVRLGDNELRYILWRSHERMSGKSDYVDMARDAAKRDELGLPRDLRFRNGETDDIWRDGSLSLEERMTEAAIRLSNNHGDDFKLRNESIRAIGGNLASLRRAMATQKRYDQTTAKRVADLARILMQSGYLSDMTSGEMQRILSAVKNSVGAQYVKESVDKVMDVMIGNQLRNAEGTLRQLLAIRGSKVDARGVEVQGVLDVDGQRTMEVFKKAMGLSEDDITNRIAEAVNRISDTDKTISAQATLEYSGLCLAFDYVQNIVNSKAEEKALRDELRTAKEDKNAGRITNDAYHQFVEATEDAIKKNKIERAEAYYNLVSRMSDTLRGSIENAKAFREAEKARIKEVHHNANSDMEGRPSNEHHKDDWKDKFVDNCVVQFLFAPLATFDQILRVFGNKSANGEGYLWNRFMRGWVDCRNKELEGVKDKFAQLDKKAEEIFGKGKTWGDIIRKEGKLPKATVSFWDGGQMRDHELTQGNLLYIYMVDKMADGRMKLRRMGITEEDVADIEKVLDSRFKALGDWLQDEFLVATRNEYNETHKRMFGASMAAIENYFPLKILANARIDKEEDVNQQNRPDGITTKTGSIIKRRVNNLALDITGADALSVILDHVTQMEHWNAYAEWNRDLNTLRTYKRFRNQVINMTTAYGGGRKLWENFNDLCLMAAGEYRSPVAKLDKAAVNLAKGVSAAKVSFRMFTALKQLLSAPAYGPEVSALSIAKSVANPYGAFKWCFDNLPIFRERWHSRISGDPRLLKSEMDWKMWRSRVMEISSRIGMTPNAFVDAVTVSIGAKAMYETRLKQYLREGYEKDAAEKRAKQDATILFNQTQQSSEAPFLSTMQVDSSWLSVLFTVFRNSAMSYTRQDFDAIRNLKRNLTGGQRAKSIEFMTKQILRDWKIDPDAATDGERGRAENAANKRFRRQIRKDLLRVATFGFILQLAWNLGPYLPYIIFGNNDDEKDKMWDDALTHAYCGSVEGLTGGDVMSAFGNMALSGEWNSNQLTKDMPLASDVNGIITKFTSDKDAEAFNDIANLVVQMGVGMNPQSITDAAVAIVDACGDDPELSHEAAIFVMRVMQVPQSQIDKMYFDEVDLSGEEASKLTPAQLAHRYAKYKVMRGTPLVPWTWDDESRLERYEKNATKRIKERMAGGDETVTAYAEFEDRYKAVSAKERVYKQALKNDYVHAAEAYTAYAEDPDLWLAQDAMFKHGRKRLDSMTEGLMNSETAEEAAIHGEALNDYRSALVRYLQAESDAEKESASKELGVVESTYVEKLGKAKQPNR